MLLFLKIQHQLQSLSKVSQSTIFSLLQYRFFNKTISNPTLLALHITFTLDQYLFNSGSKMHVNLDSLLFFFSFLITVFRKYNKFSLNFDYLLIKQNLLFYCQASYLHKYVGFYILLLRYLFVSGLPKRSKSKDSFLLDIFLNCFRPLLIKH